MTAVASPAEQSVRVPGKVMIRAALGPVLLGALLFGAAGRVDWRNGWLCLGTFTACAALVAGYLLRVNPGLLIARSKKFTYQRRWDRIWVAAYAPWPLVTLVVAGVDAGRGAAPAWGVPAVVTGELLIAAGMFVIAWAMAVNASLLPTVLIDRDGSQPVARSGPYRFVRHPYYSGLIAVFVGVPTVLGSALAYAPAAIACALVVVRTVLEDRALQRELPGYRDYARAVQARLLPRPFSGGATPLAPPPP